MSFLIIKLDTCECLCVCGQEVFATAGSNYCPYVGRAAASTLLSLSTAGLAMNDRIVYLKEPESRQDKEREFQTFVSCKNNLQQNKPGTV